MKRFRYIKLLLILFCFFSINSYAASTKNFLVMADIHLDLSKTDPMVINPVFPNNNNDLDYTTFASLMRTINENLASGKISKPDFILILGDIVGHDRTNNRVIDAEATVFKTLKNYFPDIPIFYTFGNNDSLLVNYGSFRDENQSSGKQSPYQIAETLAEWQNGFLSTGRWCHPPSDLPCLITEEPNDGYYSAYLAPQFKLISLNTVLFSPHRVGTKRKAEAEKQLEWLKSQLEIAKKQNESVLISMHIPPGNNIFDHSAFWLPEEQVAYLNLIKAYQGIIIGQLAAHTHMEELKVLKVDNQKNSTGIYFTAGLSTSHGNNPSIKTFYYSKTDKRWELKDYTTFHFSKEDDILIFEKLYQYQDYYCNNLKTRTASCLNNVTAEKIQRYFSAGNENFPGIIDSPDDVFIP